MIVADAMRSEELLALRVELALGLSVTLSPTLFHPGHFDNHMCRLVDPAQPTHSVCQTSVFNNAARL